MAANDKDTVTSFRCPVCGDELYRAEGDRETQQYRCPSGHLTSGVELISSLVNELRSGLKDVTRGAIGDDSVSGLNRARESRHLLDTDGLLRMIIDSVYDYAILTVDTDNIITSWNVGAENIFGWTEDEAVGRSGAIIFTPEDRRAGAPEQEIETALSKGRAPDERYHIRKDNTRVYISGVMTTLKDENGAVQGFVKIARDLTDRMTLEKAVLEREMMQKLVAAQEEERARLARDLHDELGQQLTVLRMRLDTVRAAIDDSRVLRHLDEIDEIAQSVDTGVDSIAWELRPLELDDLGLVPALGKYVKRWSDHTGIECSLIASSLRKKRFRPEVETNLYRIVQEALNNVVKHSRAERVEIVFERRENLLVLLVEDNGKGFNSKNKRLLEKGHGLTGMRERAALIGGSLEIESTPKNGTAIYVKIDAKRALI